MKAVIMTRDIVQADIVLCSRPQRFDGLASHAFKVEVEYEKGDYDLVPFLKFVSARTVDEVIMWGSGKESAGLTPDRADHVMMTIPPGFDVSDLFTLSEQEDMCERILKQLIEESEQP